MIVVEGPDGAGKTTLIERLSKDLEIPVQPKAVGSNTESLVDLSNWVDQTLEVRFGPYLYDRHSLVSEMIYSPIMGKKPRSRFADRRWLETRLAQFWALDPIIILCLPPYDTVVANALKDESSAAIHERISGIYWLYYSWLTSHPDTAWVWDYTSGGASEFYPLILSWIRRRLGLTGV